MLVSKKKRTRERLCLKLSSEKELSMSYGEKQAKCEVHDAAAVYVLCSRCCCKRINRPILNTTQMKEVPRMEHQQQQCLLNTLLLFFPYSRVAIIWTRLLFRFEFGGQCAEAVKNLKFCLAASANSFAAVHRPDENVKYCPSPMTNVCLIWTHQLFIEQLRTYFTVAVCLPVSKCSSASCPLLCLPSLQINWEI